MKKNNKKLFGVLAIVALLSVAGISAYFTDQEAQDAFAVAGNINLTWENKDLTANNDAMFDALWQDEFDADKIMNPGDSYDFSYTVANTGNKSIDVKQQIVLTSTVALTADAEEYKLTITGGEDAVAVVPTKSADGKTLTYDLTNIVLDGSIEKEDGLEATTTDYDVRLDFSREAKNVFMDSQVTLNYQAYAKQHRNTTDADWDKVAEFEEIL